MSRVNLYLRGPEDDSEIVETCRPKIAFYVINLLCFLTDTLYFACTDELFRMTNVKITNICWAYIFPLPSDKFYGVLNEAKIVTSQIPCHHSN